MGVCFARFSRAGVISQGCCCVFVVSDFGPTTTAGRARRLSLASRRSVGVLCP